MSCEHTLPSSLLLTARSQIYWNNFLLSFELIRMQRKNIFFVSCVISGNIAVDKPAKFVNLKHLFCRTFKL